MIRGKCLSLVLVKHNSELLFYADATTFFKVMDSGEECSALQYDLKELVGHKSGCLIFTLRKISM